MIEKQLPENTLDKQWLAIKLLEGDEFATQLAGAQLKETVDHARRNIEQDTGGEADILWQAKSELRKLS